jgi:hypothetical protein
MLRHGIAAGLQGGGRFEVAAARIGARSGTVRWWC